MTRTLCPDRTFPTSRMPWSAVHPVVGTVAASSKPRFTGFGAILSVRAVAYSANVPLPTPNTSSPGWNAVTSPPTASITPATS